MTGSRWNGIRHIVIVIVIALVAGMMVWAYVWPRIQAWRAYRQAAPLPELGAVPTYWPYMSGGWGFECKNPSQVTDATVESWIPHLKRLGTILLILRDSAISDEALRHLEAVSSLQQLQLKNTGVTDEGLESLARLENLELLMLSGTQVTDQGLSHLVRLPRLRSLDLGDTLVTQEGVDRFRRMRPEVDVEPYGPFKQKEDKERVPDTNDVLGVTPCFRRSGALRTSARSAGVS